MHWFRMTIYVIRKEPLTDFRIIYVVYMNLLNKNPMSTESYRKWPADYPPICAAKYSRYLLEVNASIVKMVSS